MSIVNFVLSKVTTTMAYQKSPIFLAKAKTSDTLSNFSQVERAQGLAILIPFPFC